MSAKNEPELELGERRPKRMEEVPQKSPLRIPFKGLNKKVILELMFKLSR